VRGDCLVQGEEGILVIGVTGVQTGALPIDNYRN
jgi:hypothetical protein